MKAKTYLDGKEFREQVLTGIRDLSTIVAVTLGPGGRPILLEQENGAVLSTKDGITVAEHFAADGPVERLVANAAREASLRTVQTCGDGTTSSLVLAYAIVEAGQQWLQRNPNYSPQRLSRELQDSFKNNIKPMIEALAKPIKNLNFEEAQKAIWHVAMVSSNSDESIANAVTEAIGKVGHDGVVTVEEGTGGEESSVVHQPGFPVNAGHRDLGPSAGASFVNRTAYNDTVINGAYVALYDGDVNDMETILPLMHAVASEQDGTGRPVRAPLVVVAHGFSDAVLKVFAQNFRKGTLTIVPIKTPRSGMSGGRQQFLHDLRAYTTGQVFDAQSTPLQAANPSNIGFCEEVKIGASQTVFLTEPNEEEVAARMEEIKGQLEVASNDFDKDRIRYRLGQLTGGIATLFAGGATALEARERRDRAVDAISAVRVALESGVVPGGGSTLLAVSRQLPKLSFNQIFSQALSRPFVQILLNAGIAQTPDDALFTGKLVGWDEAKEGDEPKFLVYDALKREYVEFWSSGLFDTAKTVTTSLQNALSVAQLLMTTGGAIARSVSTGEQEAKAMSDAFMKSINQGANE